MAASNRDPSIPIRAAMKMIALQPISFHASERITMNGNALVSVRKPLGVPPNSLMMSLKIPSLGESSESRIPYMMTHERKCGR